MIVISYGITKSGSTLAFEMAKAVLELNGHEQARLGDALIAPGFRNNFVADWSDETLGRLLDVGDTRHVVVKTHGNPGPLSGPLVLDAIDRGALRIHVVYRDPRDTVISMLDQGVRARGRGRRLFAETHVVEDAIERLGRQVRFLRRWGAYPSLRLRYETFAFDATSGPARIAADLGMPAEPEAVWNLVAGRPTQKNVARPDRYLSDLWPDEVALIERAFPVFRDVTAGHDVVGWFDPDAGP